MGEVYTPIGRYDTVAYIDDQVITISGDKAISGMRRNISIKGEANSQYIRFEWERYYKGVDISDKQIQIHYERRDGAGDNCEAVNVELSDQHIRFGWVIPGAATALDGILKVMPFVCGTAPNGKSYLLKSLYTEYTIHKGLPVSGGIAEPGEDWYLQWYKKMEDYINTSMGYAELAAGYKKDADVSRQQAGQMAGTAGMRAGEASRAADLAASNAQAAAEDRVKAAGYAVLAESYVSGTGGQVREGDDTDCGRYYYEQVKQISDNLQEDKLTFDISDQTPTFEEAEERENIASGERMDTILGKIKKIFSSIRKVAFTASYKDLVDTPDIPSVPDTLPASNVTSAYSPTGIDPVNGTAVGAALETLDVGPKGGEGKYIQSISETDGKIDAVEATMPTSLPANGGDAATVGGKTAADLQDYNNLTNKPQLFSGDYDDLTNKPTIPTIPSSLPADGGNADTVGNKSLDYIMDYDNLKNRPRSFSGSYADLTGKPTSSRTVTTTITAAGWTGTAAPYTHTVAVAGATASSIIDVSLSNTATQAQYEAYTGAGLADGGQGADSITLRAFGGKPKIDIPIKIVIRGDM